MKQTYWQRINHIIGPMRAEDFPEIGQQDTRSALEDFVLAQADSNTKLLDAGCNTGVEGFRLFSKGYPGFYFGLDSNAKALLFALQNLRSYPATCLAADAESVPYPDRYFEIVLIKDVIEHASSYQSILAELARVTGEWLVLSMFVKMHDDEDQILRHPDGYFLNRYNRNALYSFLADHELVKPCTVYQNAVEEVIVFKKRSGLLSRIWR